MKKYYFLLSLTLFTSINAWAKCELIGDIGKNNVLLSTFYISPTQPVGSVIAVRTVDINKLVGICTGGGGALFESSMFGTFAQESTIPGVYESGVKGIGIKISDIIYPDDQNRSVPSSYSIGGSSNLGALAKSVKVTFYRTGVVTPGSFASGIAAKFKLEGKDIGSIVLRGGDVKTKSCYAKTYDVTVPMGSYSKKDFVDGMTTAKDFDVTLTCTGDKTPVYVSFSRVGDATGNGHIPLSTDSTASGVEFYILDKATSQPLVFDKKTKYHTSSEESIIMPFSVRYIQSATNIKPGTANGAMTFTVTQN